MEQNKTLKFGLIGFGNHAQRLLNIINAENKNVQYKLFNHRENYNKELNNCENVFDLADLLNCDAVFITSPNDTHFKYLKYLIENFKGYVFCEKPPVTKKEELKYLENIDDKVKQKIYFNFNYRFSPYFESLKNDAENYSLGKLVNATIIQGHGLALKECYKDNWRSCKETHSGGVFETFSVHYLDMFVYLFDAPKTFVNLVSSTSPYGNSVDNSCFVCQFENNSTLNITVSYTTPCVNNILLNYENGSIIFDKEKVITGPRECFDKQGRFKKPPVITKEKFDFDIYSTSLKKSTVYFLETVTAQNLFNKELFEASLNTNKMLF